MGNPIEHPITGVNYKEYYSGLCKSCNCEVEFLTTDAAITDYTKNIIIGTTHTRDRIAESLKSDKINVYTLADILKDRCEYGLLGSNKSFETFKLKRKIK